MKSETPKTAWHDRLSVIAAAIILMWLFVFGAALSAADVPTPRTEIKTSMRDKICAALAVVKKYHPDKHYSCVNRSKKT